MCFSRPEYLPFLWLVIPSLLFALYGARRKLRIRQRIAGGTADPSIVPEFRFFRLFTRRAMYCAAIALFFFAMAGPELCSGERPERRRGADVVFMLDVSTSMFARDVAPDRLSRAKAEILQISRGFGEGRRALLLFAATPVVQCPLTTDQELFETLLDVSSPDQVEAQGSVYRRAFDAARNLFDEARRQNGGETVLVLAGDGEDHGNDLRAALSGLKSRGIRVYAIGVGSGAAVPIPLPATASRPETMKVDASGDVVMTSFRPGFFAELVNASGGRYYHSRPDVPVGSQVAAAIAREAAASRWVMVPGNRRPIHQPIIAAALLALFAGITTSDVSRRNRRGMRG
ncbi:MAG: VWA domain-containing protein [Chlorobiaceae bacterium]|nr:VWA domain-containing protein [Chlorobiaceae bacterium]